MKDKEKTQGAMRLWYVYVAGHDYTDVIGAEGALDAARKYLASVKKDQLEDIAADRRYYDDLQVHQGLIDPELKPFEQSGYQSRLELPETITCVPQCDPNGYHNRGISSDRKYWAEAFMDMWDWARAEKVRL